MLEQNGHHQDWSLWPLFGTKIGQLWYPEGPKMIQKWSINASRRALEPRMAGTSWNKCWNRITIRTNDYDPFLAHKRPIVVPRRSKNGPSECNVGLFWAIYCHFWTFWAVMHKCRSRQTMLAGHLRGCRTSEGQNPDFDCLHQSLNQSLGTSFPFAYKEDEPWLSPLD